MGKSLVEQTLRVPQQDRAVEDLVVPEKEAQLLEQVSKDSPAAFAQLYQRYLPLVHHYIGKFLNFQRADMEEVAQDVFYKIWRKRDTLLAIHSFEKFLYVVSRNTLTDFCRKRQRIKEKNEATNLNATALPVYPADERLLSQEYFACAKQALSNLPEKRRLIFELRTQEDLSLEEIAARIGMSVAGVHKNLKKATLFIREYLSKNGLEISVLLLLLLLHKKD